MKRFGTKDDPSLGAALNFLETKEKMVDWGEKKEKRRDLGEKKERRRDLGKMLKGERIGRWTAQPEPY